MKKLTGSREVVCAGVLWLDGAVSLMPQRVLWRRLLPHLASPPVAEDYFREPRRYHAHLNPQLPRRAARL